MSQAKKGDTVKVHYTGKLQDGEIFDSSIGTNPLEFTIGNKELIDGFESGVMGMKIGSKKTITIPPEEAYGSRNEELVADVDRSKLPDHITAEIGQALQITQPNGKTINVIMTGVTDDTVTLDANHPLAGKTLTFEIELVEIA
jgi:peptidylprolyl isomerase